MKRRARSVIVLWTALLVLCTVAAPAQALDSTKRVLPNGLTVLTVERTNLPVVMVSLLIQASQLNEERKQAGVAYLTGKMLTEGTQKRTAKAISEEIEFIGASLDISTTPDFTTVSLSVLKKDAEKGFDILSDVLLHPSFPEDELKRKKDLIKGSLRQKEEEPSYVAEKAFIREVFGTLPYGLPVEGTTQTIDALSRSDVTGFYRAYYLPSRATLSIVGDLTKAEVDSLIARYFGEWKAGEPPAAGVGAEDQGKTTALRGPKVVEIQKDITQANIIVGHGGISRENPDYYAVSVMNYIFGGGGFASRLMKTVRDDMGLVYSIYSTFVPYKEPGYFQVEAQTKNESAVTVIREILSQMHRMKTEMVSDEELKDAKSYLTGSFPRRLETSRKIADFLTAVEFYRLGDDYVEKYPGYITAVTRED
ncbi:MAG TPA: pitrilysin family protein, partial [Dissulfurispiraceae bacterium]|nr:pitrilysin family protein [Dissulfurispiraceae bacterium]